MEQPKKSKTLSLSKDDLKGLDEDSLRNILRGLSSLKDKGQGAGPQTDDDLWTWIKENLGIEIPRDSCCEDHEAPFDFVADIYFHRVFSAVAIANRGGMKTLSLAAIHYANAEHRPGYEGLTFGAIEAQAKRCYEHLKQWVQETDPEGKLVDRRGIQYSQISETKWINGSKVEIVTGTKSAVNGPHPQVAHADEAELMRQDAWDESRNMAVSKTIGNITLPAQNIITSTRKSLTGRMQSLVDENKKAEKKGYKIPYKIYTWCIFETAQQRPDCREAPENAGKPEDQLCDCHLIAKGTMPDGTDRTLNKICKGKFYKSRGFKTPQEVELTFTENAPAVWVAQQECRKPSVEHNYIPEFDQHLHGIRDYYPDPDFGDIYQGIDWGSGNPNAVTWYQLLKMPVIVHDFERNEITLPSGSFVAFHEIYRANIGATKLAKAVKAEEMKLQDEVPGFRVKARFADPQGRQQRNDWEDEGLYTTWIATRNFEYHVERVQEYFGDMKFYVDVDECPMFVSEIEVWQKNPVTGKQIDEFNHVMSEMRYTVANVEQLLKIQEKQGIGDDGTVKRKAPKSISRKMQTVTRRGSVATIKPDRRDWPGM